MQISDRTKAKAALVGLFCVGAVALCGGAATAAVAVATQALMAIGIEGLAVHGVTGLGLIAVPALGAAFMSWRAGRAFDRWQDRRLVPA